MNKSRNSTVGDPVKTQNELPLEFGFVNLGYNHGSYYFGPAWLVWVLFCLIASRRTGWKLIN